MGSKPRVAPGKKFMFLSIGFERPTPEQMKEWGAWFKSIGDRMIDQGGFWSGGREFTKQGSTELTFGPDAITGYVVFTAEDRADAEALTSKCPVVASNRVYEIMSK